MSVNAARILILDDQRAARRVLRSMLSGLGPAYDVQLEEASSLEEALTKCREHRFDVYLVDIHLTDNPLERGGIDFIRQSRSIQAAPAVVVSASVETQDLREAMRAGAVDYVLKDQLSPELIVPVVQELLSKRDLEQRVELLGQRLDRSYGLSAIVGVSAAIERVRSLVRRLADADATVLIRGPNGTGKELVAQALHQTGKRRGEPLVTVNCAAIAPGLVESELFGHERGAFTHAVSRRIGCLEAAGAGTVFLDEVAELPVDLQAKLLRVLEARTFARVGSSEPLQFRARVVAATHQALEQRIEAGKFREDLYYRLNVVAIDVPSLAERREDIPLLCTHFVRQFSESTGRPLRLQRDALDWLALQPWPGNVRELRNVMERLALLCDSDEVTIHSLLDVAQPRQGGAGHEGEREIDRLARLILASSGSEGDNKLERMERTLVRIAMELSGHNQTRAAKLLGVDRKALERRYKQKVLGQAAPQEEADSADGPG